MKIFKPIVFLFKILYRILDKLIITPISRLVYKINEFSKENAGRLEKMLNRPNILIYLSLICAIGIFLLVDSQVINLTEKTAEILTDQKVNVIYNKQEYVIEGVPETVDITLIGSSSSIYLTSQLGEHNVSMDLSDYGAGTYKVKLKYNHPVQSVDYKLDPSTVTVKISEKVSDTRLLSYDLMNENKLDSKLSISNVKLDTSEVVIKSSKEILDKVATVRALIDASLITLKESGDFTLENINIAAFDKDGNKLDNVEIVPGKVTAVITIDSYNAVKPVKIVTKGEMESGKAIESINSSVGTVTIYGDKETVDAIDFIEAKVDIKGLSTNKTVSVNLVKPNGIRYMSDTKTNVTIVVGVETQVTIPGVTVHAINLPSGLIANASVGESGTIDVIIKGVASVVNNGIDASSIKAYIDLSNYKVGTYTVPIYVKVDDERITAKATKTDISVKITQSS